MWKIISLLISSFILMITCFCFGRFILNEKVKINKFYALIIIILCSILSVILLSFNVFISNTFIFYICYFLLLELVFRISFKKNFFVTLICYLMLLCGDAFFILISSIILKLNGNQLYLILGGTIIGNLSVAFLCLLLSLILRKFIIKLLNINIQKPFYVYWIIIFIILSLFFVFAFTNKSYNFETYLVLLMVFVIVIIIFISFFQVVKNNELENKYDKLLEFIKKYEIEIDKQRTMRHETKNQLLIIKSKLIDKDNQKNVISYIDEIIKDNNKKINHSEYAKLRYLPSNGLKGLFYFKVDEAIEKEIKVDINVSKNIENSFLYNLNSNMFNQLGKVLGIFLDNAIEAAKESKDKILGIEIYLNKNYVNFIISNSYLNVNDNLKSTKGITRGHGLLLVKTIIGSNNKFSNVTEVTDKLFIQKIMLEK